MKKVLLTSVCRPLGPKHGDGSSVGYELLHRQVTRAQGLFGPRSLHLHFSLEYIAENLQAPTTVLQYPSRRELIRELKKGYDFVGVSFLLAVFHKMKDAVALIRRYAPQAKIILGGYGTVLKDEVLKPYGDYICREEGVAFLRNLLGEAPIPMPYKHPLVISKLKVFSRKVSNTGMIFAGLGCPNGCDFCCTSHFFSRKHIRLLPSGADIHQVIERYLDLDPTMSFVILDEDFLLNKKRALELRDCVQRAGKALSIFVFSSVRAISQYTVTQILEMGITGFWIGYEGTRSGYSKQQGRPIDELFRELRENGITILASMIVGFDYQNHAVVQEELDGLLRLKPSLAQFLIYGPTPGTPFYERIMKAGLLQDHLVKDPERYYRECDGFRTMIKHPTLTPAEIEAIQADCFEEDFQRLGPSIFRVVETALLGYRKFKDSENEYLRKLAQRFAGEVRAAYPVFRAGRWLGPNTAVRRWIAELEQAAYAELGRPASSDRLKSYLAVGAGLWTDLKLKLNLFEHPALTRTSYRLPKRRWSAFDLWEELPDVFDWPDLSISVDLQHARKQVWMRLEGTLNSEQAAVLIRKVDEILSQCKDRLVLDLKKLSATNEQIQNDLRELLEQHGKRIRLIMPTLAMEG